MHLQQKIARFFCGSLRVKLVVMTSDIKPEKGSERVKSWVYAILNPAIESLRRETALLKTGNLSWRAHTKRCEYIRPVDELIDPPSQPILDDFLAEDPTLRDHFNKHDAALARLEEKTIHQRAARLAEAVGG